MSKLQVFVTAFLRGALWGFLFAFTIALVPPGLWPFVPIVFLYFLSWYYQAKTLRQAKSPDLDQELRDLINNAPPKQ